MDQAEGDANGNEPMKNSYPFSENLPPLARDGFAKRLPCHLTNYLSTIFSKPSLSEKFVSSLARTRSYSNVIFLIENKTVYTRLSERLNAKKC